jgi:hypothetical protein
MNSDYPEDDYDVPVIITLEDGVKNLCYRVLQIIGGTCWLVLVRSYKDDGIGVRMDWENPP